MRLIDADELTTAFPLGEYVRTECVQATIDYMQTIEAIPVEWLNQKYAENDPNTHEEDYDYYIWDAIAYILTLWREEHGEKENEENTDN